MTVSSFAEVDGIPGPAKTKGFENMIELFEFNYRVKLPTDPRDGKITGRRKHDYFTITHEPGKHSPSFIKHLCDNLEIAKVTIHHNRPDEENGDLIKYFVHTLEKVKVVNVELFKYDTCDKESEPFRDMEKISMVAESITMADTEGNEHTDSWES